ncbi:MAG: NAD(P)H-hydrate dehydratase [Anaerolineaceae bacterium]
MKLVSVEEMKAIEAAANSSGLSYATLMKNAGEGVGRWVDSHPDPGRDHSVLGLIGSGNNGGDTLVALTFLSTKGWKSTGCLVRPRPVDDPLVTGFLQAGGVLLQLDDDPGYTELSSLLKGVSVLLDGILGTGTRLPLDPLIAGVLDFVGKELIANHSKPMAVAIDCPSGVDCHDGAAATETIHADVTLTMAAAKLGMFTFPAYEYVGTVVPVDIGLSDSEGQLGAIKRQVIDDEFVRHALPERRLDSHKGDFGTALLLVGSEQYTGAALLAGEAAYRVGAGLVIMGVVKQVRAAIAGLLPEVTWIVLPDAGGYLAAEAAGIVLGNIERANVVLAGCGWGLQDETHEFLHELLPGCVSRFPPMVVDADGLKLLARIGAWQSALPVGSVLTPHPGEMAILSGMTSEEVQEDRLGLAERSAKAWNQVVVLKGALTVVAAPDGQTAILPFATPALARAGTGDVLAGMIAGLMAQGVGGFTAACAGAYLHGRTGIAAAEDMGNTASVLAGDLLIYLPGEISRIK